MSKNAAKTKFNRKMTKIAQNGPLMFKWTMNANSKKISFPKCLKIQENLKKIPETHQNSQNDTKIAQKCPN